MPAQVSCLPRDYREGLVNDVVFIDACMQVCIFYDVCLNLCMYVLICMNVLIVEPIVFKTNQNIPPKTKDK